MTLKRSIEHLYPIEVKANDTESESDEMLENPTRSKEVNCDHLEPIDSREDRRPQHQAAI